MKKFYVMALILVLCALLFTGCRDNTTSKAKIPATSAATQTTLIPSPDITLPLDTTITRPAARGPRS